MREQPRIKPSRILVELRGEGFGQFLDLQQQISALPGVACVSISAIDTARATLVVELESDLPGA